ncbi:peptide/nickel transport system substrate-binding protein [Isoptericola jiangsuensis]|uniref:Peptide/nickel transport system substrate-binding protein n=1 Tax=Isoptericola jiangsuensis TaxID=548579 RepID=A0A2A9EYJ9_9MICO|nr:ABC transporter substrate-binding protein [Isoptericola jiangsuensis]PFG43938.1 peptide/nickel transport system substrate-binding protein [Isoptericola jiangsuensis]
MTTQRRTSRRVLGAAAASAAIALTAACTAGTGTGAGTGTTGTDGGGTTSITVFNGATGTINENWNPFSPTALQPTLGVIYEPLFWYNLAETSEPTPLLGTDFSWNYDGSQLTITTREGVTWSDGEPFTAADVAFTFNLLQSTPELNTSGTAATAEATDDTTVVLTFPEPSSFMQEAGVLGNQAIVAEHVWSEIDDPVTTINPDPVGTGAFTLKEFSPQSYVIEANENYWDEGKPAIDEARYISLETADAAAGALLAGQVDWMSSFLPGLDQMLADNEQISYVNTPALTASVFTCSNADLGCEGPQTDPAVRQAIYHALDRTQLNQLAGGGFAGVASPTLLLPERDAGWVADDANLEVPQTADVAAANKVLDDAGWEAGDDGIRTKDGERLSMTIQTVTGWADFISLNDTMKQQLAEVGIELKPTQIAWNEWNDNQVKGNFQLSLDSIGLGASDNPYYTYNGKYRSTNSAKVGEMASGGNYARYDNPTVDAAIEAAAATADEAEQKAQYAIVQEQIVADLPYIPIYVNSTLTEFNNTRVTGWPDNDDKYAFAASWKAWDNGIVLKTITPAG